MKRVFSALTALLLVLAVALPVFAIGGQEDNATPYIHDQVGLLTEDEVNRLEQQAEQIAAQYSFAVNIAVVEDFRDFNTASVYEAAKTIYQEWGLGYGSGHDGILLLLSMDDRDYANIAYGYGNTAFTDYGKERMDEQFLDDFRDDDWYDGFSDYLRVADKYLQAAADGKPFDRGSEPSLTGMLIRFALRLVVPLAIAGIYVATLTAQMKSVAPAGDADEYLNEDSLKLRVREDVFTHTTRTETKIEHDRGSGGGTSVDSGGFSGTSGKF